MQSMNNFRFTLLFSPISRAIIHLSQICSQQQFKLGHSIYKYVTHLAFGVDAGVTLLTFPMVMAAAY